MKTRIEVPDKFKELFLPNHGAAASGRFTAAYKSELKRRMLRGEAVTEDMLGVKTIVLKGGRISGKTMNDEIASIQDFFGVQGDIWYCRSEENTIRRSIFQSMQSTLRGRGFTLSNRTDTDFKVSTSPFEIKCNKTGNVCQFFAINKDIDRTKAMTPPSGRLKRVMLEEANEPNDKIYVEALRSTALRYMDEMSKFTYRYNPPPTLNHWANRYYPSLVRNGAVGIHTTWEDIAECLDPVVIADNLADFENPVTEFNGINSPANMEGIIEGYQASANAPLTDVNEKTVQRIGVTAPTLVTEVTLTVNGTGDAAVNNAEVVVRGEGGLYATVANREDGTYTFTLPRASEATVLISADGYQTNSSQIALTQTATATLATTVTLTAAAAKRNRTSSKTNTPAQDTGNESKDGTPATDGNNG